jgi:hypothetical protein
VFGKSVGEFQTKSFKRDWRFLGGDPAQVYPYCVSVGFRIYVGTKIDTEGFAGFGNICGSSKMRKG